MPSSSARVVEPPQGRVAVLDPGRKGVLGREPILDGGDHDAELAHERRAERVLHLHRAGREPTTVDVEQGGSPVWRWRVLGGVHAHEHLGGAVGTGSVVVGDDDPGRVDRGVERRDQLDEHRPGPFEVVGVNGRQELQDRHQLGIDRVGHAGRMTEVSTGRLRPSPRQSVGELDARGRSER